MADLGANKPPLILAKQSVDGHWLCTMFFGKAVIQDFILTNGCTKAIAVGKMKKHAKALGIPFPKRVPVTAQYVPVGNERLGVPR